METVLAICTTFGLFLHVLNSPDNQWVTLHPLSMPDCSINAELWNSGGRAGLSMSHESCILLVPVESRVGLAPSLRPSNS